MDTAPSLGNPSSTGLGKLLPKVIQEKRRRRKWRQQLEEQGQEDKGDGNSLTDGDTDSQLSDKRKSWVSTASHDAPDHHQPRQQPDRNEADHSNPSVANPVTDRAPASSEDRGRRAPTDAGADSYVSHFRSSCVFASRTSHLALPSYPFSGGAFPFPIRDGRYDVLFPLQTPFGRTARMFQHQADTFPFPSPLSFSTDDEPLLRRMRETRDIQASYAQPPTNPSPLISLRCRESEKHLAAPLAELRCAYSMLPSPLHGIALPLHSDPPCGLCTASSSSASAVLLTDD